MRRLIPLLALALAMVSPASAQVKINGNQIQSGTVPITALATTGTPGISTWLRGDYTWTTLPDAMSGAEGILQLTHDLGGTATSPSVVGLQGHLVASTAPTDTFVLTWVSADSMWEPKAATGGSGSTFATDKFATSGTSYTISHTHAGTFAQVFFDGVLQPSTEWSISGTTLTLSGVDTTLFDTVTVTFSY